MPSANSSNGSTSARFVKNEIGKNYNDFSRSKFIDASNNIASRMEAIKELDEIDTIFGFSRFESGPKKTGWLVNMHATTLPDKQVPDGLSAVDYYFLDEEGGSFKVSMKYEPYFFIICAPGSEAEVEEYLRKILENTVKKIQPVEKEDLDLGNHLIGLKRKLLKLSFHNVSKLLDARRTLTPIIDKNQKSKESKDTYSSVNMNYNTFLKDQENNVNFMDEDIHKPERRGDTSELIEGIREYDVPYHVRVSIDKNIRIGKWYEVEASEGDVTLIENTEKLVFADPVVLAFDIETTKAPLKFPDASVDQIMMISYMIDGEGYLITNREIISEDIEDFEYTPKPEYQGLFTIFNEPNEKALIERFFEHVREAKPTVIATFNGDFFDWPFVETRALYHDLNMYKEIGFAKDNEGEYKSTYCVHMDCYRWVKRDSYLPQGSQGLKAVTTAKLGYNPTELDPELMTPYAYEKPQLLSEYSVSDAVATYYLYYKYVHPFIFSLASLIPLNPDEVLRKGTGTLCEMLLMVQAYNQNILLPNKHGDPLERFYDGHLLESETYVGGHVESLEAGVFRADIATHFNVDPTAIDEILADLHNSLRFSIEVEGKANFDDVTNYDEIYNEIKEKLLILKNNPKRHETPLIYHVDVASMYPNIMTTNRLQPDSMKTEKDCAACDFNRPGKKCDRRLPWSWRGEFYPAEMNEYAMIKNALQNETFPAKRPNQPRRRFDDLPYSEQVAHIKKRISDYSRKVYHRIKKTEIVEREAIICQRENPFYINTVRDFRDRRYDFKGLAKVWKGKAAAIPSDDKNGKDEAKKMVVLYDSLQLAHKVILNSFYGYVMRKGSRWYSMEMAGITCLTGATIIQMARSLVERLGRPLELDTDGIWCILPSSFPENYVFKLKNGKKVFTSYPCSMLNYLVHEKFTNHQYQDLVDPVKLKYKTRSDNSIFFEVDGPYKAMILPTSKEEGKGLKKRYAVFEFDGSLAELKGFELKRRGELQLIKNFQSDIFKLFLEGDSLETCYQAVANVANRWLDVLDSKGAMLEDEDLIELICENRSMSKTLDEYEGQKSTSITTAKRLGEFLGEEMVKDKGLACKYIICRKPANAPVTERAIPTAIFASDIAIKRKYLRRWCADASLDDFDPRGLIDWNYYAERLASVVQKIITIPAALQGVKNPVPRVEHPDWLNRKIEMKNDKFKQSNLNAFLSGSLPNKSKTVMKDVTNDVTNTIKDVQDIEDFGKVGGGVKTTRFSKVVSRKRVGAQKESPDVTSENPILGQKCPDPAVDYIGFLNHQKAKWEIQSKEKERRRKLFGNSASTNNRSAVGSILKKQAEQYSGSVWQILQYKIDPSNPGELKVFVVIDGKIQTLKFNIPKKLYITFRSDKLPQHIIPNCTISPSSETLPVTSSDVLSCYKMIMPEKTYVDELNNADSLLKHKSVSGIYESNINSIDRCIIELGNSVKFEDSAIGALGKALQTGFDQKSLKAVTTETYLQRFSVGVAYLLHVVSNSYEIFTLFNSWDSRATVFCLKPSAAAQNLPGNISSYYSSLFESKKDTLSKMKDIVNYPSEMDFEVHYFTDIGKLYKKLNSNCAAIQDQRSSKPMFVIQSAFASKLISILKSISQSPTLQMNIGEISLSTLAWSSLISKRIINHYLALSTWLKKMLSIARYGNIPLCNLKVDDINYLIDVEYARRLQKANHVLWWSSNPIPDFGGLEKDESLIGLDESFEFPTINVPEIYESVSLEVDVKNLTINTILTSSLINEAEGVYGSDSTNSKTGNSELSEIGSFAEDTFSGPALVVLRSLVKGWWDDAMKNNSDADSMIYNFVSWVQSSKSYLYDSKLHYHIHNLSKKSMVQLIGEFRKMGSSIVFADMNKVILKTSKTAVENSYAYGNYVVSSARSKPLFNYLELNVSRYWDLLVWMDQYNFAGRYCEEIIESDDQEQVMETISKWQMKSFLPSILQQEFDDWVITILDSIIKNREERFTSTRTDHDSTPRRTQITQLLQNQKDQQGLEEEDVSKGICEYFRVPLIKRIRSLIRKQQEVSRDSVMGEEYKFPKLPGSHLNLSNPTLELTKCLVQILSLSKKRSIEVRMLRKELLELFEIKEFNDEGMFKNASTSLSIPQVLCEYCNHSRDIDACKDDQDIIWNCESCSKPYNKLLIDEKLIIEFTKMLHTYFQQDLKCDKCHKIKENELSLHCKCSGSWVETINKREIVKKARVFGNVADAYNLKLLRETIDTVWV